MTKSAQDIIEMAYRLDGLKAYLGAIDDRAATSSFSNESFSLFPLYYSASKHIREDIINYEPAAIRAILNNDFNSDRVNTVVATTMRNDVWIDARAFDMFVDAANGNEINPQVISPDLAEEIVVGMINIAGIEGSMAMPFKNNVLSFIRSSLDFDGWDIPPLPLMFKNITDLYEDKADRIAEVAEIYGDMSLLEISRVETLKEISAENDPSLANYFMRNQEVAEHVLKSFSKTMYDWTTIIRGK